MVLDRKGNLLIREGLLSRSHGKARHESILSMFVFVDSVVFILLLSLS